eukprot:6173823-Pleurochrysis_carterae.AAC.1
MKNAGGNRRNMPPQVDGRRAREDLFRLDLIDAAVQLARKKSPRVLLVLHVSHAQVPRGSAAEALFQSWKELNLLYLTPRNQPDDLYWLYAAIASGKRCAVISNDEMRDHTSSLFAGRMFAHWKQTEAQAHGVRWPACAALTCEVCCCWFYAGTASSAYNPLTASTQTAAPVTLPVSVHEVRTRGFAHWHVALSS